MKVKTHRILSILICVLLVLAPVSPLVDLDTASPIQPVQADASDSLILDDAEDNDENIEANGWDGYYYVNGDALSPTSSNVINGSYSQKLSNGGNVRRVKINSSTNKTPSRMGFRANVLQEDGDTDDNMNFRYKSNGTTFIDVEFEAGSRDLEVNGEVVKTYQTDKIYDVEFTNLSYTKDSFDLWINHEKVGTYSFSTDVDGVDAVVVSSDSNINSQSNTLVFDDLQLNGSRYNFPPATTEFDGDFEDGNLSTNVDGWAGWTEDNPSVSVSSTEPISGNQSMYISPSDNVARARMESNGEDVQHSSFQARMQPLGDNGDSADNLDMLVKDDGKRLFGIQFQQGTKEIRFWTGSGMVNASQHWKAGHVYNVSIRNVSWTEKKWSAYINGKKVGRYSFYKNSSDYEAVAFQSDSNAVAGDSDLRVDDIAIEGSQFKTYSPNPYTFSFDDEPADAGLPENWTDTGSTTGDFRNVTTKRAYDGSQSVYWGESVDGSYLEAQHEDFPSARDYTSDVNFAVYKTANDSDPNGNDATKIRLLEDTEFVAAAGIRNDGMLIWRNSSKTELVNVGTGKWVELTITDIDPKNDTATLVYDNGTDTGKFTGLSFANDVEGYDDVRLRNDENGYLDAISFGKGSSAGATEVSGTVVNQNGQPISNATVQLTISKKPDVSTARDQLENLSDPIPTKWSNQMDGGFNLLGSSGTLQDTDAPYALIYDQSDLGTSWSSSADLGNPHIASVPANEEVAIIAGDPTANCGLGPIQDEYDSEVPGCVLDEATIHIEKLSGADEVTSTATVTLSENNDGQLLEPAKVDYASFTFAEGVYRITVETSEGKSAFSYYVMTEPRPTPDINQYQRNAQDTLTDQAQAIRDAQSGGSIETVTVTTDSQGRWSYNVSTSAKAVTVSALKAPGVNVSEKNLNPGNISTAYSSSRPPNASVYLPSRTKTVEPPESGVTITLIEVGYPGLGDIQKMQSQLQELRNKLENLTLSELNPGPLNEGVDETRAELASTWSELRGILMQFPPARERYLELADRDSVPVASDLSKSELRSEITTANTAITTTQSTADATSTATETTQDTISTGWEVSGIDLSEANVSAIASYSNGTRTVVDDQYVVVDEGITSDTVRVEEFPLGESDPAQVSFELNVAGPSDGVGDDAAEFATGQKVVKNPTYTGDVPGIASIELSSIRPGPQDTVRLTVNEERDSSFRNLSDVTVYGPDGTSVSTSAIKNGDTVSFETSGKGVYQIKYTATNTDGKQFTDTVRVRAAASDQNLPPTVYAHSGPLGTVAMASDGLNGGSVEVADDGSVEVIAQTPADNVPQEVHVHTSGLSTGPETPVDVRVVKGEDRQSAGKHMYVYVHAKRVSEDALVYRNGDEPITRDASTRFGKVTTDADGTTIKTWTDQNGVVTTTVNNDPSWIDRQQFRYRIWTAGIDVPVISVLPDLPAGPVLPGLSLTGMLGAGVIAHKRRS